MTDKNTNPTEKATPTPLEDMSLKQLQAYLTELGFESADVLVTKDQCKAVIANYQAKTAAAEKAIKEAEEKATASVNNDDTPDNVIQTKDEKGKVLDPLAPRLEDKINEKNDQKRWEGKAAAMKAMLAARPKVSFLLPLSIGEKRGSYETVIMNGYRLNIMKGVMVEIPDLVAKLLAESYQLTAEAGSEFLVDRADNIKETLG